MFAILLARVDTACILQQPAGCAAADGRERAPLGVGALYTGYVVRTSAGWQAVDVAGTQSDGVPRVGLQTSVDGACACALDVSGCADRVSQPSVIAPVVACVPSRSAIDIDGVPTYDDGHLWWHVSDNGGGWMLHELASCLSILGPTEPQKFHSMPLLCMSPPHR